MRDVERHVHTATIVAVLLMGSGQATAQEEKLIEETAPPLRGLLLPQEEPKEERDSISLRPERAAPSGMGMSREAVRQIPGALDDPTRAIDVFPGQSWLVSGIPHAFVRGEPPDNTGYYLDGIRIPMVHHFGIGPSVIPPSLVDRVDFYPGAAPSMFGRASGGVVVLEPVAEPSRRRADLSMRLFDAGASAESPFADGRGRARVGARYAYSAALASLISQDYAGWYGDYHARASYEVSPADRIGIFAIGAHDDLVQKTRSGKEPVATTQFHRLDIRYDRQFGRDSRLRAAVLLGHDRAGGIDERYLTDKSKGFRVEVAHRWVDGLMLWWGGDLWIDSYETENAETSDENHGAILQDRNDRTIGFHVSAAYRPSEVFEAHWGIRADAYHSLGEDEVGVDPRGSLRVRLHPRIRAIASGGVAHQPPSALFPLPGIRVAGLAGGLQKSVQTSGGAEWDVSQNWSSSLVGFRHWHRNTSDFLGTLTTTNHIPEIMTRTNGSTTGAEVTLHGRPAPGVGAYLAYTLSRSTRTYEERTFVASFDRTHVGTGLISMDLGNRWHVGGRLTIVSGVPRNDPAAIGTDRESERVRVFYRIDGRAEKRWVLSGGSPLTAYLEVMNMTANRERLLSECEETGCLQTKPFGPVIVPNLGAELGFW